MLQSRKRAIGGVLDWLGGFNSFVAGHVMDHGFSLNLWNLPWTDIYKAVGCFPQAS